MPSIESITIYYQWSLILASIGASVFAILEVIHSDSSKQRLLKIIGIVTALFFSGLSGWLNGLIEKEKGIRLGEENARNLQLALNTEETVKRIEESTSRLQIADSIVKQNLQNLNESSKLLDKNLNLTINNLETQKNLIERSTNLINAPFFPYICELQFEINMNQDHILSKRWMLWKDKYKKWKELNHPSSEFKSDEYEISQLGLIVYHSAVLNGELYKNGPFDYLFEFVTSINKYPFCQIEIFDDQSQLRFFCEFTELKEIRVFENTLVCVVAFSPEKFTRNNFGSLHDTSGGKIVISMAQNSLSNRNWNFQFGHLTCGESMSRIELERNNGKETIQGQLILMSYKVDDLLRVPDWLNKSKTR